MSNSNLLQGYTWDSQYDDPQQQFSRPIQDEVISVYEVYVKEETVGADGRSDISIVTDDPAGSSDQLMQGDCLDLDDAAIGSEVINVDGTITKLLGKDTAKYKILEQNTNEENVVVYPQPMSSTAEGPGPSTTRLVDKDDPRSRLHFVKYLKRDGKTLKIWECGICSKEFRHQYTLMRHLPTHTDERNFKCEACGKAFRQLSTLSQHRAIHSDARPYICEFCKKTFNRVSTLISHRKTHSEQKPHKCHMCGKGFHQKGNLRNHVFTHTNERPYKCETCNKGFNQMSNLMCHKVKAHAHAEKMQYVCGICGKEFPRRFSLRSHEEYKHGIKYRNPNAPAVIQDNNDQPSVIVKNKNVSIVSLPNGERPMICDVGGDKENLIPDGYVGSVIVDKIETKAMENAILEGQTPFALFKPAKGIPVLVKVTSCPTSNRKQVLTPATAEDLRIAGKMAVSPTLADVDGVKAVQIKVPVVATVTQRIEPDGNYSFLIEPPGPGQEQESLIEPIESQFSCPDQRGLNFRSETNKNSQDQVNSGSPEDCNDLLELAAQGGIQFVRATEDGRYEVMTNSEARDLMAQNSHDVTILDGEEAEAISIANLRNQQQQHHHRQNERILSNPDESHQEIIIGDSNNEITVLNSGTNSLQQMIGNNNSPMNGIEIHGDKDIRILDGCGRNINAENEDAGRCGFPQNRCINIFDEDEKMIDDFSLVVGKDLPILNQENNIPAVSNSNRQNIPNVFSCHNNLSNNDNKNLQHHHHHQQQQQQQQQSNDSSIHAKNETRISILQNHNFHNVKTNNHFFSDNISSVVSSSDPNHSIMKNHLIAGSDFISTKLINRISDFDNCNENLMNLGMTQNQNSEVKILGSRNLQNSNKKIKILGNNSTMQEKIEMDKVFQLVNPPPPQPSSSSSVIMNEPVKILGSKNHHNQNHNIINHRRNHQQQLLQSGSESGNVLNCGGGGEGGGGGGDSYNYKDLKVLSSNNFTNYYDQYINNINTSSSAASASSSGIIINEKKNKNKNKKIIEEIKILGKKKDSQIIIINSNYNNNNNNNNNNNMQQNVNNNGIIINNNNNNNNNIDDFDKVSKFQRLKKNNDAEATADLELLKEKEKVKDKDKDKENFHDQIILEEPDNETYLSLMRINTWLRKSC